MLRFFIQDPDVSEDHAPWAEVAWYNQAADTNEGVSCYEMSPVEDSYHSPSCASNLHAAGTSLVAQLRADADPAADPSTRKLPPGERAARLEDQRKRLVGLQIEGPLECAYSTLDLFAGMICVSRNHEIMNLKPSKELKIDSAGSVNVRETAPTMECQIHTELECQQAMQRRALAMDAVGLISFEVGMAWINSLFNIMTQPVAPGFARISLVQLLRTDRVAFARMSELSRGGIRPSAAGVRPLDNILKTMRDDSSVMFYMLPTLAMHAPPKRTWDEMTWGNKGKEAFGKGKLPEALRKAGCVAMDRQGRRRCFGYNLDGSLSVANTGSAPAARAKAKSFAVEWSLEQPHRSLFWKTVWWRAVLQHLRPYFIFFANCMHGGARPKRTCLATSVSALVALSRECDNQHTHFSWGKCGLGWSTTAEVEYPHELCKLWSQLLIMHLVKQGAIAPIQHSAQDQPHAFSSVSTLTQTRKSPALMPEFKHVQSLTALKPPDLKANAQMDLSDLIKMRTVFFNHWTQRAKALTCEEKKLHQSLPTHRREILKGKRLLLMKEMLTELGYRDVTLVDDLISGFSLVGQTPDAAALPSTFQPAFLSEDDLLHERRDANLAILHSTQSTGDAELDHELWTKSQEEVNKGWLAKIDDLKDAVNNGRISRRFPLRQGGKVRCVDNYSESQINDSITITSKVTVDGPDTVAASAAETIKALQAEGKCTKLKARALDLKSAYRQLPISDSSLKYARLSIFNPESQKAECFQQYAVPFGARASVVAFIRCARALQWLALQIYLIVTCYFDDYCNMAPDQGSDNAEKALTMLFDLLGWSYDRDGPKSGSMSESISLLGVVLNLSQSGEGKVLIENTASRKEELKEEISRFLAAGRINQPETSKLKGRMTFAEGQLFGRVCRALFNALGRHLHEHPPGGLLDDDCRASMTLFLEYIQHGRPRAVDAQSKTTFFLFTDAHFETSTFTGGIGAVLVDNQGKVVQWFSHMLDRDNCRQIATSDEEQIITELEAVGVLAAINQWKSWFCKKQQKHMVCFLDNEGARGAILRGRSHNSLLNAIAHQICETEDINCIFPWYARIPSISNLADPPSRGIPHPWLVADKEVKLEANLFACLA
ncbi:unnamed protein product [Symbiodinium pilosum]|uniref:Uncharacterized protein n=1 Tax=Symbiodinium pilosum TaxID=2952 RepID=A0A812KA54_SYMPI|nr:unnamed protein product [Symbiodinium pilosum]